MGTDWFSEERYETDDGKAIHILELDPFDSEALIRIYRPGGKLAIRISVKKDGKIKCRNYYEIIMEEK